MIHEQATGSKPSEKDHEKRFFSGTKSLTRQRIEAKKFLGALRMKMLRFVYSTVALVAAQECWTTFSVEKILAPAEEVVAVVAVDFNDDGSLDVLSASEYGDSVTWHTSGVSQVLTTTASEVQSIAVGDVDGDEKLELVVASWLDDTIAWYDRDGVKHSAERD